MVSERYEHLTQHLNKLKRISNGSKSLKDEALVLAAFELKKLIPLPFLAQLIEFIKTQNRDSVVRQQELEEDILFDFDTITRVLMGLGVILSQAQDDPLRITERRTSSLILQMQAEAERIPGFFSRYAVLQDAVRSYYGRSRDLCGPALLTVDDRLVHPYLRIPNFVAWEQEKIDCLVRSDVLKSIARLFVFNGEIGNYGEENDLRNDLQKICRYLTEKIISVPALALSEIKSIGFKYTEKNDKQPAKLTLLINDKTREFSQGTASLLKRLLENPNNEFDIDDIDSKKTTKQKRDKYYAGDKNAYDRVFKKAEGINQQISLAKEFLEFDIAHFIIVENYCVKINPLYAGLIQ